MQQIQALIALYIGAVFFNSILSAALWYQRRDPLTRMQFLIWLTTLLGFVLQGAPPFQQGNLAISLGYSSIYLLSLSISALLAQISHITVPWSLFHGVFAMGLGAGAVANFLHQPFFAVAAPIALGVAFPTIFGSLKVLATRWRELTFAARAFLLSALLYSLHMLDFAVLRDKPQVLAMAFTIGILVIFMMSVFAPAVIIEMLTKTQARVAAEMDVARHIQTQILPKSPSIPGLELACYMKPADEVGGDYYDIITMGNRAWILLGDVTGHGLSSGLVMLMAQSIISAILHTRKDISPRELNLLANEVLFDNLQRLNEDRQMTIVSICVQGEEHGQGPRKAVFSGYHDNIFIYRAASRTIETVHVTQLPCGLGFLRDIDTSLTSDGQIELHPNDLVVLITDGVSEAAAHGDYQRGLFLEDSVVQLISAAAHEPVETIKKKLVSELESFTGGIFHDDVTFMIARVKSAA